MEGIGLIVKMRTIGLVLVLMLASAAAGAQSVTLVENFGTAQAAQVKRGLGFNIDPAHEWEFQLAQQIGSSYVRFDCPWTITEKQNPDNSSGGFTLPPGCAKALAYAKQYGQHPSMNALYGPPYRRAVTASIATDVPAGSYVLPLTVSKGELSSLQPLSSEILLGAGKQITVRHSYSGSLITAIDAAQSSVVLAAATSIPLPAGTQVAINQILYPPVLLTNAKSLLTDPSIAAFGRYAHFLAEAMHQAGVQGEVGLWNEPVWAGDPWDNGDRLFDKAPPGVLHLVSIPLYVSSMTPVEGVNFDSGYTEKTGFGSIYAGQNLAKIPSLEAARKTVTVESFHPYGNAPEDHFWYPDCLKKLVGSRDAGQHAMLQCAALGSNGGSNFKFAVMESMQPQAHGGAQFNITETGICSACIKGTTDEQVARYILRQFIGYQGLKVSPIMFYRLADRGTANGFGWIDYTTRKPLPVFTAMKALMTDVDGIAGAPASLCALPTVASYTGFYPLATVAFVGAHNVKDKVNSVLFFTWQKSYPEKKSDPWVHLASPATVPVTLELPKGMTVTAVRDTISASPIRYTVHGRQLDYAVADNPVEIALTPSGKVADAVACSSLP